MRNAARRYLKRHTERLIKDVGYAAACALTGRSQATLGRHHSEDRGHADRFMPVDAVAAFEAASSFPNVTAALAELNGRQVARGGDGRNAGKGAGGLNAGVIAPSRRFRILVSEHHRWIEEGGDLDQRGAPAAGGGAGAADGSPGDEA
jgi:hypothetical protein